jgi:hypothetical protein
MYSAATALRSLIGMTLISIGSSDVSWPRSRPSIAHHRNQAAKVALASAALNRLRPLRRPPYR